LTGEDSITVLVPKDNPGTLATIMERFWRPGFQINDVIRRKLVSLQVFSSKDGSMSMDIFRFAKPGEEPVHTAVELEDEDRMFKQVAGTENTMVEVKTFKDDPLKLNLLIAASNVIKPMALQRVGRYLGMHGINLEDALVSSKHDETNTLGSGDCPADVLMMDLSVRLPEPGVQLEGKTAVPHPKQFKAELQRVVKWLDDQCFDLAGTYPEISFTQAEIINCLCSLEHSRLGIHDPYSFTRTNINQMIRRPQLLQHVIAISDLFIAHFNPSEPLQGAAFDSKYAELGAAIERSVADEKELTLMTGMLRAVKATLRTNLYMPERYALALRLDPTHTGHGTVGTEIPYGVFFISGRRFKGFHVRFRDIARGGLRVVAPNTEDQHAAESARIYNEAYSLAFAQQLKNKDIPEGGSKAAVLLEPHESDNHIPELFGHNFMVRKCVRATVDCILDLTSGDDRIVDYLNKPELIYLGPDERIIPQDIEWIINRAVQRNYAIPQALMSSKARNGINHKQFGVTSEGVAVNLEVGLREMGMHPEQTGRPFTVKLTGGPDGDVAGNMIRLLSEQYGDQVRIVGLADGSACLEDPTGIDMDELMRMVHEQLPLSEFNPACLGPQSVLSRADTLEGSMLRNNMHNRVTADAFVPAGGRPGTINIRNYRDFLSGLEGAGSSPLVVEGANLFITPEARQALFDQAAVVIIKDSSANKCGVVTSSQEILASMVVSPDEFVALKEALVPEVLAKLKQLARVEAEMLFRERRDHPDTALPVQSVRVSVAINRVHDAVVGRLQEGVKLMEDGTPDWNHHVLPNLTLEKVVATSLEDHVPACLLAQVGLENMRARVPWPYLQNILACTLATSLVYNQGLTFAENLPQDSDHLADAAFRYLEHNELVEIWAKQIEDSGIASADSIVQFIHSSQPRVLS